MDQWMLQNNIKQLRQNINSFSTQLNQLEQSISRSSGNPQFASGNITNQTSNYPKSQYQGGQQAGTYYRNQPSQSYGGSFDRATNKQDESIGQTYYQMRANQQGTYNAQVPHYQGTNSINSAYAGTSSNPARAGSMNNFAANSGSTFDRATNKQDEAVGQSYYQMKGNQGTYNAQVPHYQGTNSINSAYAGTSSNPARAGGMSNNFTANAGSTFDRATNKQDEAVGQSYYQMRGNQGTYNAQVPNYQGTNSIDNAYAGTTSTNMV